jgi:hypothetical protein
MAGPLPSGPEGPDLSDLLDVKGFPVSSFLSVELCRFMPSFAPACSTCHGTLKAPPTFPE